MEALVDEAEGERDPLHVSPQIATNGIVVKIRLDSKTPPLDDATLHRNGSSSFFASRLNSENDSPARSIYRRPPACSPKKLGLVAESQSFTGSTELLSAPTARAARCRSAAA
jgi:hypothetical protein